MKRKYAPDRRGKMKRGGRSMVWLFKMVLLMPSDGCHLKTGVLVITALVILSL